MTVDTTNATTQTPHPLLVWVEKLTQLDMCEAPDDPVKTIFGSVQGMTDWFESGRDLIHDIPGNDQSVAQFNQWLMDKAIDRARVSAILSRYDVNQQYTSGNHQSTVQVPLHELWDCMSGAAIIQGHGRFPDGVGQGTFLWKTLDTFFARPNALVDATHEAWLHTLCDDHKWMHETVTKWLVFYHQDRPNWGWAFDDRLMDNPSPNFLEHMVNAFDAPFDSKGQANQTQRLKQMALGAPAMHTFLENVHSAYTSLWGVAPLRDGKARRDYCEARMEVVHTMFAARTSSQELALPMGMHLEL